jgi:hypothetical protein
MPRKARIDAPVALHHIMARGIEGRPIFQNEFDRNDFINRLAHLLEETETKCLAWAPGKERYRVRARSLLCFWASRELRISQSEVSRKFKLSPAIISQCVQRGENIVRDNHYSLFDG